MNSAAVGAAFSSLRHREDHLRQSSSRIMRGVGGGDEKVTGVVVVVVVANGITRKK